MKLQKSITSKLFYGKWPYKIQTVCPGSYMIKRQGVGKTLAFCYDTYQDPWNKHINKERLLQFLNDVELFVDRKDIQVRTEGSNFDIFCADKNLFNQLCTKLRHWIREIWEPANDVEYDFIVNNSAKKVLCNHIPFNQYPYKVYIKYNMPRNTRTAFKTWVTNYEGKIKTATATHIWLNGRDAYNALIIYVADQPTLSMVGMFLGNSILRVEEFIPRSRINISLDQEETCPH